MAGKSKAGKTDSNSGDRRNVGLCAAPTESSANTKLNSSNSKRHKSPACRPSSLLLPSSASRRSRFSKAGRRLDPVDVPAHPHPQLEEIYAPKSCQTSLFPGSTEDGSVESSLTEAEGDNQISRCHHFGFTWQFQAPGWARTPGHPQWLFYILTLVLLVNLLFVLVELRAGARVY